MQLHWLFNNRFQSLNLTQSLSTDFKTQTRIRKNHAHFPKIVYNDQDKQEKKKVIKDNRP